MNLKTLFLLPCTLGLLLALYNASGDALEATQFGHSPLDVELLASGASVTGVKTDFGLTFINRGAVALDGCAFVLDDTLRVPLNLVDVVRHPLKRAWSRDDWVVRGRSDLQPGEALRVPFSTDVHPDAPGWKEYRYKNVYARAPGPHIVELVTTRGTKKWTIRRVAPLTAVFSGFFRRIRG
jgi:hypothetical protein